MSPARLFVAIAVGVLLAIAVVSAAARVMAHDWYEEDCCSGEDCAPLPRDAVVKQVRGGYAVTLPGREPVVFSKIRPSRDRFYHACMGPYSGTPYCLYVPLSG